MDHKTTCWDKVSEKPPEGWFSEQKAPAALENTLDNFSSEMGRKVLLNLRRRQGVGGVRMCGESQALLSKLMLFVRTLNFLLLPASG